MILRYFLSFVAYLGLAAIALVLSNIYFDWLFPLKEKVDWLIFLILTPVSFAVLTSQAAAAIISSLIIPEANRTRMYQVLGIWIVINVIASFFISPAFNRGALLSIIQSSFAIYTLYNFTKEEYKNA